MANFFRQKAGFIMLGATAALAVGAIAQNPKAPSADQLQFYTKEVAPILKANCLTCHAGASASGGLSLTGRDALLKGGTSGAAISTAKPQESLLLHAINYKGPKMPPQGKLPQAQIDVLTKWVAMGAPFAAGASGSKEANAAPVKHGPPPVNAETMNFWSFRSVKKPAVPKVKNAAWVRNPIDAFVMAKLEANHLKPAPPASKTALLRRVTYDLIGLPPTPAETSAFLADKSPNAYEKVVDRLLASPHYGEKWARHWLDLVRYAETNSFERDDPKPFAWRYRDYVIHALNADKPYDRFVKEQLAGDELPDRTPETLIATGYYRLGLWDDEPSDPDQARYDELDDIVATTGQVFMGLTVNCARCHDHKIDPIPQKDYYRLLAFFQGVQRYGNRSGESVADMSLRPIASLEEQKRYEEASKVYKAKMTDLDGQILAIEDSVRDDFTPVEKEEFRAEQSRPDILKKRVPARMSEERYQSYIQLTRERNRLRRMPPPGLAQALCVTEAGSIAPETCVLLRGNPHAKGDVVTPGFPSVLGAGLPVLPTPAPDAKSSGRRLVLANWITNPTNKLTGRVIVNRFWQFHFGRGIVRSPSNFGFLGTAPTHPELLDWLAATFVSRESRVESREKGVPTLSTLDSRLSTGLNWSMKKLHRLILLSNTYRMSTQADPKALAKDPENDLLWRFDMRRLDAEEVRDSILAVNGSLNLQKTEGPSIYPEIPKEVLAGQSHPGYGWTVSSPRDQNARSIYIHIKRSLTVPLLASFDSADTDSSCPVRFATTQPTQALSLMNSEFINKEADVFADYLRKHAGTDPQAQVRLALQRTLQREPTGAEITRGITLMQTLRQKHKSSDAEALRLFCIVALNLNEFIYLE